MSIIPCQGRSLMKELVHNKVGAFQAWIVIKMDFLQVHFSKICLLLSDTYFKEGISIVASAFYFSHGLVLCMIDFIEKELLRLNSVSETMFKWFKTTGTTFKILCAERKKLAQLEMSNFDWLFEYRI